MLDARVTENASAALSAGRDGRSGRVNHLGIALRQHSRPVMKRSAGGSGKVSDRWMTNVQDLIEWGHVKTYMRK